MSDNFSEQDLIQQAQANPQNFQYLYPRYVQQVYSYISYKVGRQQDVEDLVSETFLRALENIYTFEYRGELSFKAWLISIARNVTREFYRKRPPEAMSLDEMSLVQEVNYDDHLIRHQKFKQIYAILQTLAPRRREIILMKYYGGLRNHEIASLLGIKERTVSSQLSRALTELQAIYNITIAKDFR